MFGWASHPLSCKASSISTRIIIVPASVQQMVVQLEKSKRPCSKWCMPKFIWKYVNRWHRQKPMSTGGNGTYTTYSSIITRWVPLNSPYQAIKQRLSGARQALADLWQSPPSINGVAFHLWCRCRAPPSQATSVSCHVWRNRFLAPAQGPSLPAPELRVFTAAFQTCRDNLEAIGSAS